MCLPYGLVIQSITIMRITCPGVLSTPHRDSAAACLPHPHTGQHTRQVCFRLRTQVSLTRMHNACDVHTHTCVPQCRQYQWRVLK